ncbi:MAG: DNA polymerase III subunit gamma/tau, partial [Patescibacteria group bacterium]
MHELALYRKYRPQTFKEVIGQDHIVDVLKSSVEKAKVSHAYLFIGSRGTGKTSVARIFAKEIGVSDNDLYEIDAASNRGIEDIKELRTGARVLPFDSKYKIYIIDEVHMLSKDAWGALLKLLEEPPRHVIFILATTEVHKVPDTIVSRCQVFTFKKPTNLILKNVILDVTKKEGFTIDGAGAELLAILGDGSFRDALGTLQKVLNHSTDKNKKKKIEITEIEEITGAPKTTLVNEFLESLISKEIEKGISTIRKTVTLNNDISLYARLIIEKMRATLILKYAPKLEKEMLSDFGEDELAFLKKLAKNDKENIFC